MLIISSTGYQQYFTKGFWIYSSSKSCANGLASFSLNIVVDLGDLIIHTSVYWLITLFNPQPDIIDNKIPEVRLPTRPTVNEIEIVQNSNEIPLLRKESSEEFPANVLMAHASDDSIFNKTEVLAGQCLSIEFFYFLKERQIT